MVHRRSQPETLQACSAFSSSLRALAASASAGSSETQRPIAVSPETPSTCSSTPSTLQVQSLESSSGSAGDRPEAQHEAVGERRAQQGFRRPDASRAIELRWRRGQPCRASPRAQRGEAFRPAVRAAKRVGVRIGMHDGRIFASTLAGRASIDHMLMVADRAAFGLVEDQCQREKRGSWANLRAGGRPARRFRPGQAATDRSTPTESG